MSAPPPYPRSLPERQQERLAEIIRSILRNTVLHATEMASVALPTVTELQGRIVIQAEVGMADDLNSPRALASLFKVTTRAHAISRGDAIIRHTMR